MGLFKFLSPDRLDVLRDGRIRFTQPGAFDDPLEFRPDVTYSEDDRQGIQGMAPRGATSADIAGAVLRASTSKSSRAGQLLKQLDREIGVLSLARSPKSLAMWAYYADGHRGFVIELNRRHEFFVQVDGKTALRPVLYSKRRARFTMEPIGHERDVEISGKVMTTKGPQWRHEREVRVTANLVQGKDSGKRDRNLFPVILFPLPPQAIKRVIMGFRMAEDDRRALMKILNEDRYSHVQIDAAELHDTQFDLEFVLRRRPI